MSSASVKIQLTSVFKHKLTRWSFFFISLVIFTGIAVLLGWQFNIEPLKRPIPYLVAMNPATAFCFIITGTAFIFIISKENQKTSWRIGYALAWVIILISLLKLINSANPSGFQIDHILFAKKIRGDVSKNLSSSMAINTALGFLFSAIALLLLNHETKKGRMPSHFFALLVFAFGFFSALGYLYKAPEFFDLLRFLPMAVHTAICFMLISLAIFFVYPHKGITKEFTSSLSGAFVGRIFIVVALVVPAALGLLRVYTHRNGFFSVELGITFLVLAIIIVLCSLLVYSVILLNKKDLLRKKTEERFRLLLESAPDAVVIVGSKGKIELANTQAEKMFEYTKEEMVGERVEMLMPERYRSGHESHRSNYFSHPKVRAMGVGLELFGKKKSGTEFFIEISLSPLETEEGTLVSASIRDITERKKAEKEILDANLRFTTIFNLSPVPVSITTLSEGRFILVNDAFCETTGYKREDIIGKKSVDIKLIDSGPRNELVARLLDQGGQGKNIEQKLRKSNGEILEVFSFTEKIDLDNEPCFLTALVDITERNKMEEKLRRSEEIFRSLVTSVKDYAIFMLDINGNIITWNKGAEEIKGYTANEILGRHISVFYTKEDIENKMSEEILNTAKEKGRFEQEGWRVRKDGSLFWANMVITALYNSNNELTGFAKVTRDMTERKRVRDMLTHFNEELSKQVHEKTEEIERTTEQLRQLSSHLQTAREEERKSIAREIHDELGQMLTGLRMDVVWLRKHISFTNDAVSKRFEAALELLNQSRQTMRRISTGLHPAVLEDLGLLSALELLCGEFEKRSGIKVSFVSGLGNINDSDITSYVKIGLYRVFQESLTNIAKHSNAKKVNAYLKMRDNNLVLSISDDGIGFEPSAILGKKTLGLISIRERALMMNGSHEVHSIPEEGTTILLIVPLNQN